MNVLVVYAHHEPSSYTAALKNVSLELLEDSGHTVVMSDLNGLGFQAVAERFDFITQSGSHFNYMHEQKHASLQGGAFSADIVGEQKKLKDAELVIFHFPLWWGGAPAILKGWFDRVLAMGTAWDGHEQVYEQGLLHGKRALVVTTAAWPPDQYTVQGRHKATIEQILHPLLYGTLAFCGMDVLQPYVVFDMLNKGEDQLRQQADLYREYLNKSLATPAFYSQFPGAPGV